MEDMKKESPKEAVNNGERLKVLITGLGAKRGLALIGREDGKLEMVSMDLTLVEEYGFLEIAKKMVDRKLVMGGG